jgi:hypothetical protein
MALNVSRPVRCAKCGTKFTRTHGRQRFCITCIPNWRRTRAAVRLGRRMEAAEAAQGERLQVVSVLPLPEPDEAFGYADLCRMWATRTAKLMAWTERTGRPVREYPDFPKLTAREVSVAIGWVPWPAAWPVKQA